MRSLTAAALTLALVVPAAAQAPARSAVPAPTTASSPTVPAGKAPATAAVMPVSSTSTPAGNGRPPAIEAAIQKAQKAADDRAKAWDAKMRRTMGSICKGC